MKFSSSLKLNHIFQRLYRTSGQANGYLVLYARKNRTGTNRVGITVSKKLGKANVRNRIRRTVDKLFRRRAPLKRERGEFLIHPAVAPVSLMSADSSLWSTHAVTHIRRTEPCGPLHDGGPESYGRWK